MSIIITYYRHIYYHILAFISITIVYLANEDVNKTSTLRRNACYCKSLIFSVHYIQRFHAQSVLASF